MFLKKLSCTVGFLFSSISITVQETIDYIMHENYIRKILLQTCSITIFRRWLLKVTTKSSFLFKQKWYKQIKRYSMSSPLSVTLANILVILTENNVIKLLAPLWYIIYTHDMYNGHKKSCSYQFCHDWNSYLSNRTLIISIKSMGNLIINIITKKGKIKSDFYCNCIS